MVLSVNAGRSPWLTGQEDIPLSADGSTVEDEGGTLALDHRLVHQYAVFSVPPAFVSRTVVRRQAFSLIQEN